MNIDNNIYNSPLLGYANHRILTNDSGEPVDYEFLDINPAFEKLTGLKKNNILKQKVTKVIPGIRESGFDWVSFYGRVALKRVNESFEQYFEPLKKWFLVQAYPTEQNCFATVFLDITSNKYDHHDLIKTNRQFLSLVDNIPGITFRCLNDKDKTIIFISSHVESLTGYKVTDFINNSKFSLASLIYEDDRKMVNNAVSGAIKQNRSWQVQYRLKRKNGSICRVYEKGKAVSDELDKAVYLDGFIMDISDRLEIEEKLRLKTEQFELAIRGSDNGIWDWNILTDELFISERFKEIIGYQEGELENSFEALTDLIFEQDSDHFHNYLKRYMDGVVGKFAVEFRMKHKDGSLIWLLAKGEALRDRKGTPYRMAGSCTDISERRQSEEKMAQLAAAFEQSPATVIITDTAGNIEYANPKFEETTGYTLSEVIGKNPRILKSDDTEPQKYMDLWKTITGGREWRAEFHNKRKDGSLYYESALISPVRSKNGTIISYIGVKEDITERKERELLQKAGIDILDILNKQSGDTNKSFDSIVKILKERLDLSAVGIRMLRDGDFPFLVHQGFPSEFISSENTLLSESPVSATCFDANGKPCFECTCGLVVSGKTDNSNPLFTNGGSFFTNNSESLLHLSQDNDLRYNPRNTCIHYGYKSFAIVPVKANDEIVGTIQLNDKSSGRFSNAFVEELENIAAHVGSALLRRQAEAELEKSEVKYRQLIENIHDIVYSLTPEGNFTYVSPAWTDLLGHDIKEVEGKLFTDFVHPDDHEACFNFLRKVITTNQRQMGMEYRVRHIGGEWRWHSSSAVPVTDQSGNVIAYEGIARDITEQKLTLQLLKQSEERHRYLFETISSGVVYQSALGEVILANTSAEKILGKTSKDLRGKKSSDILFKMFDENGKVIPSEKHPAKIALDTGKVYGPVDRAISITGKDTIWLSITATPLFNPGERKPYQVYTTFDDITWRKDAEKKLKENILFLNSVFDSVTGPFAVINVDDYTVAMANTAFGGDGAVGKKCYDVSHGFNRPCSGDKHKCPLLQVKDSSKPVKVEHIHMDNKGNLRNVEIHAFPVNNPDGDVKQVIEFSIDITEKKQLEAKLRESEERFALATDGSDNGIWDWDITGNKFYFSPRWKEQLGYKDDELSNEFSTFEMLLHKDDKETVIENINKYLEDKNGTKYRMEFRMRHKDGTFRWIMARGEALRDKNGKAYRMSGSHSDITDRKEAEARMAAFSAVVENSDNIIVVKDLNLRVVATNNAFARAAGKSDTEELIGKTDAQIFNVNPQTEPVKTYMDDDRQAQKLSYGEFIVREELVPGTDGQSMTVLTKKYPIFGNTGQLIGTGNISTDITERKRAEEESRNLSKMLSVLVKIASEYINITHDLVNEAINNSLNELGEFVKADRAYVFDYIWDKNICRNTYEWCRDGIPPQIDNLQDVSLDLISGWVGKHKDSETVFVPDAGMLPSDSYEKKMLKSQDVRSLVTQPIIRDGECIGFIGFDFVTGRHELTKDEVMLLQIFSQILVNINTRKELEHDLVHSKELALQASRAKSEFLANMSHEIRTPLNGIIGFTDLLSKTPLNGMQKQYCENVNTSGKSLLGIINDVLDFSKIEAGRLELDIIEVDLINLIEECADIIKYHADKKSLELIIEISPGIPRFAMFDPVRLKQIVTNLLSNSVKFTEKGEVHLELKFKQNDLGYGIYHFSVKDSGIGLTKDQQKKLFRAFSQADSSTTRKFGGTGLGLKISGELAIMMGSAISVRSVFGKGSTFSFAVKAKLGNNTKNVKPGLPVNKVLVVDDNFNSRRIIAENLKFWGVNSTQCDSGQGALDLLKEKSFDLLIIDQYMPQISGLRTVKTIRNILKLSKENLPIIILHSASDGHELVDEIESLDISSSLIKPVKIDKLYKSIETIGQNFDKNHDTIADNSYFEIVPLTVNIKILIAEDVEMNMALMKTLIGQMIPQAKITEAFNGKEAVEAVTNDEYDLVFMDVQMPEMDGLSATRKIRDLGYEIPIIALTAGAMDSGRKEALESGMNDFITKPVVADSLAVLLKQYLVKSERAETEQKAVDVINEKATAKQGDGLKLNSVKQKIFDRTGQNEKLYYMLLEIGLRTIPQYLQKLDQAVARSSYPEIKIVSHSLKGALLNLAINDLAAIASEIQDLATLQSGMTQIAALNRKLLVEWESIQTELQQ